MTAETIIKQAAADGVRLAVSSIGTLKATGEQDDVNRWLPSIREHKQSIVKALLERTALTGALKAVRAWLTFIGEHDPAIINDVLDKCRADPEALAYFTMRADEVPANSSSTTAAATDSQQTMTINERK